MYARSGDVIFRPTTKAKLKSLPSESHTDFVVAEGEATGHAHRIKGPVEVFGRGRVMGILLKTPAEVTHDEHASITLDAGAYAVDQEREIAPGQDAAYAVAD